MSGRPLYHNKNYTPRRLQVGYIRRKNVQKFSNIFHKIYSENLCIITTDFSIAERGAGGKKRPEARHLSEL